MLTLSCIIESRRFLKSESLSNARKKDFLPPLLEIPLLRKPLHFANNIRRREMVEELGGTIEIGKARVTVDEI